MVNLCKTEEMINKKYSSVKNLKWKINVVTTIILVVAFGNTNPLTSQQKH